MTKPQLTEAEGRLMASETDSPNTVAAQRQHRRQAREVTVKLCALDAQRLERYLANAGQYWCPAPTFRRAVQALNIALKDSQP